MSVTITGSSGISANSCQFLVGQVIHIAGSGAPSGFIKCNGAAISRATYSALFAICGTTFGTGDGSTTFNVPDLRGEFIRGLDDGRAIDTGRTLGSAQSGQNLAHNHAVTDPGHSHIWRSNNSGAGGAWPVISVAAGATNATWPTDSANSGISIQNNGGTENRPRNVARLACIFTGV